MMPNSGKTPSREIFIHHYWRSQRPGNYPKSARKAEIGGKKWQPEAQQ
jgi:hypothetical protein